MASQRIGSVLRAFRKQRGLSQVDLAERARVTNVYLSQVEDGQKQPSPKVLRRLATALDIEPIELYRQSKEMVEMIYDIAVPAVTLPGANSVVHGLKQAVAERRAPVVSRFTAEVSIEKVLREEPARRRELLGLRRNLRKLYPARP